MSDERDSQLEEVLAAYFLAKDSGDGTGLDELCHGDAELAEEAQSLIDQELPALRYASSDEPGPAPDLPFDTLGDFELIGLLGRGGMGTVYLAEQRKPARMVALKVVELERMGERRRRLRFEREVNLAASLDHPNIVPLYAIGEERGVAYLAMKRLRGPSLSNLSLPLPPREVARLGARIARALEEAHLCGVLHRDVKPSNILLDGAEPVLVDFGLARSFADSTITQEGNVAGTLPYLAPELFSESAPRLDPRWDVYSLGITLYELLTGAPPFAADDRAERTVTRILMEEPARIGLRGEMRDLETIVLKAIEKDPRQRIVSAGRMAEELEGFLEGRPTTLKPIGIIELGVRKVRRHKRTAASASIALILLMAFGGWSLRAQRLRDRAEERTEQAFEQDLSLIANALDLGRHRQALELLEGPRELHADDPRLIALASRAEALDALDGLMNQVVDVPTAVDLGSLEEAMKRLEAADATTLPDRIPALAIALARWYLDGPSSMREVLGENDGDSRAHQALLHLADKDSAWQLTGFPQHADEHLLVVAAMYLGGRPLDEQIAELRAATLLAPAHTRTRYVSAITLASAGRYEEALANETHLLSTDFPERLVHRNLARLYQNAGQHAALQRALTSIPREEWTPLEASYEVGALIGERDWEAVDEALAEHLERFGDDTWPLLRMQADAALARGDREQAAEMLEAIWFECPIFFERDIAAAELYRLQVDELHETLPNGPSERAEYLAPIIEMAEELLEEIRYPHARGTVLWKRGASRMAAGQLSAGLAEMDEAITLIPTVPWARKEYIDLLLAVADSLRDRPDAAMVGTGRFLELEAWKQAMVLDEILATESERDRPLLPAYLATIQHATERVTDWRTLESVLRERAPLETSKVLQDKLLEDLAKIQAGVEFIFPGR